MKSDVRGLQSGRSIERVWESAMTAPLFVFPSEDPYDYFMSEFDFPVFQLLAEDPDHAGDVEFQIVPDVGGGTRFYITPDYNELSFIADPDFEAPADGDGDNIYQIMVRAEDVAHERTFHTIYVHVADDPVDNPNSPPEFVSDQYVQIDENLENAVYLADAPDPDGDTVTYEIIAGADKDLLSIDPTTGEVFFNDSADFEHPL